MKVGHRFFLHPILSHPRSRFIFFLYLILSSILGALCWIRVNDGLTQAGVSETDFAAGHPFLMVLLSPYLRWGLILISSWIAAGLTSHRVVGPIERMETWLEHVLKKESPLPNFRLRKEDPYYKLVALIHRFLKTS